MSHWRLNCKNNLLLRVLGDQINLRALDFLLLEQIHHGQSGPAGHLARSLRGPQAFAAQRGDASSFNAQSRRNRRGIGFTHYLTEKPPGFNSENKTNNCSNKYVSFKTQEVCFNLLVCGADNAWPQASALAYSHTPRSAHTHTHSPAFVCRDLGSASISSFGPVLKNKAGSSFLQRWPQRRQRHLLSENVPAALGRMCLLHAQWSEHSQGRASRSETERRQPANTRDQRLLLRVYLFVCWGFFFMPECSQIEINFKRTPCPSANLCLAAWWVLRLFAVPAARQNPAGEILVSQTCCLDLNSSSSWIKVPCLMTNSSRAASHIKESKKRKKKLQLALCWQLKLTLTFNFWIVYVFGIRWKLVGVAFRNSREGVSTIRDITKGQFSNLCTLARGLQKAKNANW